MLIATGHNLVRHMDTFSDPGFPQIDRGGLHFRSAPIINNDHPLTKAGGAGVVGGRRNGFQAWVNGPPVANTIEAAGGGDDKKYDRRRSFKMPRLSGAAILVVFVFPLVLLWHYTHNLAPLSADFDGYEGFEGEYGRDGVLEPRRSSQYPFGKTAPLRSSPSVHRDDAVADDDLDTDLSASLGSTPYSGPSSLASSVSPIDSRLISSAPNHHGLLYIPSNMSLSELTEHPITTLIGRAEKMAEVLEDKIKSIRTLDDAVSDYVERWGRQPPAGFEKWYEFASSQNSITAPSLLSYSHSSILPYLSYPASLLRERLAGVDAKNSGSWWFEFSEGDDGRMKMKAGGPSGADYRARDMSLLIEPILQWFPKPPRGTSSYKIHFHGHDGPGYQAHHAVRDKSRRLAEAGKLWKLPELFRLEQAERWTYGWSWPCGDETPLKRRATDVILNELEEEEEGGNKGFVLDHQATFDYCNNPKLMDIHGTLINDASRAAGEMMPLIAYCKTTGNSDIMGVPLDAVNQTVKPMKWSEKTIPKLFWRGSLTGAFHNSWTNWRASQRERAVYLATAEEGQAELLLDTGSQLKKRAYDVKELNELYLDVAPVGGAVQCDPGECEIVAEEFDYAGRMSPQEAAKYKFVLDVDGNGWSSRFKRLLTSTSVILKSTIFPEWNYDILVPWYHYVPVQVDYSDVYDIMAYFVGPPGDPRAGHDDKARLIAERAREFSQTRFRWEDMQSYVLLLSLEYVRMISDDREAASYDG